MWYTPYQFAGNSPIRNVDMDGLEEENYLIKFFKDWLFGPQGSTNEEEIRQRVNNKNYVQEKVDNAKKATQIMNEGGHLLLDGFGSLPVVGEPADGLNALWYFAEGDKYNAGLSLAGMIPFAGWGATGMKLGGKFVGTADEFYKAIDKLGIGERIAKFKEIAQKIAKENNWTRNKNLEKKNPGRTIYTDENGINYSLDKKHGTFEVTNKKGKHQGEIDFSGEQTSKPDKTGKHDLITK